MGIYRLSQTKGESLRRTATHSYASHFDNLVYLTLTEVYFAHRIISSQRLYAASSELNVSTNCDIVCCYIVDTLVSTLTMTMPAAASGWHGIVRAVREVDGQKVEDVKDDVDTLLIFVRCPLVIIPKDILEDREGWFILRSLDRIHHRIIPAPPA